MITVSKLQTKITIMLVIILAVSIGLNNVIGTYLFKQQYAEALKEHMLVIGGSLKNQWDRIHSSGIPAQEQINFDDLCKELVRKYEELSFVDVVDADGRVLFSSRDIEKNTPLDVPELTQAVHAGMEANIAYHHNGKEYLGAVIPFLDKDLNRREGSVIVIVESNKTSYKLSSLYKYPSLLSLLVFVVSFFLILLALSRWVTRPLRRMVQHMDEAAAGNLNIHAQSTGNDEIGQLGRAFNRMVKQISGLLERTAQTVELEGLYNAELRHRQAGEKLRHAISSVSSTLDEHEVNERILVSLRELIPYSSVTLWISHYDHITAMITRYDDASTGYRDIEYSDQQAREVFGLLQAQKRPVVREENRVTFLHLPILIESRVRGMLIVQNAGTYSEGDVGLAFTYASQVGSYIQNAQLYRQMQRMAATDVLTGIYNRRHFFDQAFRSFQKSVETNSRLGIIMFDVDHFKRVNDHYGHPVGDLVLASVAGRVSSYLLNDESQIFGRYGGEEFVILIKDASEERVSSLAEQIREGIRELSFPTSRGTLYVTASLGIAYRTEQADTLEKVLKAADNALYEAKAGGRNCVAVAT
ncbi:MAG: serine/threonine protein kinase [Paenibacillus sp.]|jgi:diguanylate cyclase (GGDEF)-like protein|nr:serine/threonine protein kinase [Paenibacillus sp.]